MNLPLPIALGLLLLGIGLVVWGLILIYPPAALLVGGGALTVGVWRGVDV
jgi:hypothetical protein